MPPKEGYKVVQGYGKSGESLISCAESHWGYYLAENKSKLFRVSIVELDDAVFKEAKRREDAVL